MITFFIKTYGCQANVADSQGIAKFLTQMDCQEVATEGEADLLLVNTCAIRDKAEQKLYSYIGALRDHKAEKPYLKVGIIGCVASYKKNELYKRFDLVTFVAGAREELETIQKYLVDLVVQLETTKQLYEQNPNKEMNFGGQDRDIRKKAALNTTLKKPLLAPFGMLKRTKLAKPTSTEAKVGSLTPELKRSFINIMTGCDKRCTYCIVPFTRGKEVSYPASKLLEQVEHDVANGAKEINLVGQNVNSYVDPESGKAFPTLLERIAQIEGEFWVRYVSPHPRDMTVDLFDVMAAHRPKLAGYVHFPVQSGSNKILELMKRNHSIELFIEKVGWLRERMPDATVTTDIIVGFPGETEQDYQATRDLMEKVRFDHIYSFIYSPRKYTKASKMADDCPYEVKEQRLRDLQKRQIQISREQNEKNIGKTLKCLVEKRLENGKLLARTEGNVRVLFLGSNDLIGRFIDLHITGAAAAHLDAKLPELV
ncbi:MAG: MiaB/RimO family radical SAM methylthiotransferase [Epsilonproteobacteria bacterium]|nr:MiaB/RimO family radical SAM methylthiotransferase [Campylobacterota bacterium]